MHRIVRWYVSASLLFFLGSAAWAQLPPPPVPAANPVTEAKRLLGKILFWDERLSSDDTVACGTCHMPARGGGDGRMGVHPGPDGTIPSPDDIFGSPGVRHVDASGAPILDPLFGLAPQVTRRAANTTIAAAYAPALFWDGRSGPVFDDPETGAPSLASFGALENQAVAPILSDVEMARAGRTWSDVRTKLARSLPLVDATNLPPDVANALAGAPGYPALFGQAFGDPAITAERIAFALATYERTLVPNQAPWDRFVGGDPTALTPGQVAGWDFFRTSPCSVCHTPPVFTNHTFRNIGMRPPGEDLGRQEVTGLPQDRGRFKVPTLRNIGLKTTHMHNGRVATITDSVLWYRVGNPARFPDNLDPILPVGVPGPVLPALVDFLANGLTDPRVAAESFPFDRPELHGGNLPRLTFQPDHTTMTWPLLAGVQAYRVYRGDLTDLSDLNGDGLPDGGFGVCISAGDPDPADGALADPQQPAAGQGFFYLKGVIDATGAQRGLGATSAGRPRAPLVPCS